MGPVKHILYTELGIESMKPRQWYWFLFLKIQSSVLIQYLNDLIHKLPPHYATVFSFFPNFKVRPEVLRNSFFPYTVYERNNLDNIIKLFESYLMFRKKMLNLMRPKCNETYGIYNPTELKLLTSLLVGLSHLNDRKLNHNFRYCINPFCLCNLSFENNLFLHCHYFVIAKANPHEQY